MNEQIIKNLKIIYKLAPLINPDRRFSMQNYFLNTTDKIQLMFENISNPLNVHACIRTAMNMGISTVHYVQKYDNLYTNFYNMNKANTGSIKWMDVRVYNTMTNCLDTIRSESDPIFISTSLDKDSIDILELKNLNLDSFKSADIELHNICRKVLNDLFLFTQFKREEILNFRNDYKHLSEKYSRNEDFIENMYLEGKFLDPIIKYKQIDTTKSDLIIKKPKTVIFIFGNESRGISSFIHKISDYKVSIPHFGYADTSYNLSVTVGMVLFYLYTIKALPGSFGDVELSKGTELIAKKLLNKFQTMNRSQIKKLNIDEALEDY